MCLYNDLHNSSEGRKTMVGAMYITYGPLITILYSAGKGSHDFDLRRGASTKDTSTRRFPLQPRRASQRVVSGHLKFAETLKAEGYKLRYSGGFVPDINQVLIKWGGVFTNPGMKKEYKGK